MTATVLDGHLVKPYDRDGLLAAVGRSYRAAPMTANGSGCFAQTPEAEVNSLRGSGLPLFDPTVFNRTARHFAPEVVVNHLQTVADRGEALLLSLRQTDALTRAEGELADEAHAFIGCAGMFGYERVATLARRLEQAIRSDSPDVPLLAYAFAIAIEATVEAIHDHIASQTVKA